MFCKRCGAKIIEEQKFCDICGKGLSGNKAKNNDNYEANRGQKKVISILNFHNLQRLKGKNTGLYVGIIIVICVILPIIVGYFIAAAP